MSSIAFRPGVEIETRFQQATSTAVPSLSGFIVGPAARTVRYNKTDEQASGLLGTYDSDGSVGDPNWTSYAWPALTSGEIPDASFTKLYVKKGMLQYHNEVAGTAVFVDRNTIKRSGTNFIDNPSNPGGYPGSATFGDRGVKVGDRVLITGTDAASAAFTLATYVTGFSYDLSSASNSSATASSSNTGVQSAAAVITDGATVTGDITTAAVNSYDGRASGYMVETYLIEVIRASTGGVATTALLKVTSASGTDDQSQVVPAAFASNTAIGTRGLAITFDQGAPSDNFTLGETWTVAVTQAYAAVPTTVVAGTYNATDFTDRVYQAEVLVGGTVASGPKVRISEVNGKDITRTHTLAVSSGTTAVAVAVGSYGVTLQFAATAGLVAGNSWKLTLTAAKPTNYNQIKLAHSVPSNVVLNNTSATCAYKLYIVGDYEIPSKSTIAGAYNFTSETAAIKVAANINIADPNWTISDVVTALPLMAPTQFADASKLYAHFRMWQPAQSSIDSVSSLNELSDLVVGPSDEDNPLKYALTLALSGSGGRAVYYYGVGDPSVLDNWTTAFTSSERSRDAYGIVPLSNAADVLGSALSFVNAQSAPDKNMDKVLWVTVAPLDTLSVCDETSSSDEEVMLATITDNPDVAGTQYTYLTCTSANSLFVTNGVRAGDEVRINFQTDAWDDVTYDSYVVAAVVNEAVLKLEAGPSVAMTVARKFEVYRVPNVADRVAERASQAIPYQTHLARFIPAATVSASGKVVPSYFLAAYLSGLRAKLAPHQAMTRYPLTNFEAVPELDNLSETRLNDLAEAGSFLVMLEPQLGILTVRHGITAGDYANINLREESIISNVHSIKFALFDVLNPYIGQANLTPTTIALITTDIKGLAQSLLSANADTALGGQLLDLTIKQIRQSPVFKDTLLVDVEILVPAPVNRIRLTLFVR